MTIIHLSQILTKNIWNWNIETRVGNEYHAFVPNIDKDQKELELIIQRYLTCRNQTYLH